jgi:hypothetical protein
MIGPHWFQFHPHALRSMRNLGRFSGPPWPAGVHQNADLDDLATLIHHCC